MELELYFLDRLSPDDIVCYIYKEGFGLSNKEIEERRKFSPEKVYRSMTKINRKVNNHLDGVAGLEELFNCNV